MKTTGRRYWMNCFLVALFVLAVGTLGWAQSGTFRVAMQPPVEDDPALISSDAEIAVANAIYDYVVDVSADNAIELRLAEDIKVSDDGLTYTVVLKDGVHFHDGSPLMPGDVVWTFDRLRNPDNGFPTSSLYKNIASIEVTGSDEVTFHLIETNPFFLYDLADNHALVLKRGTTDFTEYNGTGPFIKQTVQPGDRMIMTANPDYFIAGLPSINELQFIFFTDSDAAVDALRGGQIEMAWRMTVALYVSQIGRASCRERV